MVVAGACRSFPAGPGSGTVLSVLRRFRPTLVVVAGFCIGLALQSFDKVLPRYAMHGGGAATVAKIVDWTAPPLAGALLAAALLAAQRYKRLHDAERAASRILADRLTGVERPKLHRVEARLIEEGEVPDEDLALLTIPEQLAPVQVGNEDDVQVGDDIVVIGAPYGRSLSVSSGIVSQLELDDADGRIQRAMKTDAPIGYGASGGGVFSIPSGKLIGLVEGYRTAKVAFGGVAGSDFSFDVPMPGETFLAPPSKVRAFLARAGLAKLVGIREPLPVESRTAGRPVASGSPRRAPLAPRPRAPRL